VAGLARLLYNEPYRRVPYRKDGADHVLEVGGRGHRIGWRRSGTPATPSEFSVEHFLKEHDLGVGRRRGGEPLAYRVEHPVWRTWPEVQTQLDVDFAVLYGRDWAFLGTEPPLSSIAAEGSAVRVFGATPLVPATQGPRREA
jgi:hypothetical protein